MALVDNKSILKFENTDLKKYLKPIESYNTYVDRN